MRTREMLKKVITTKGIRAYYHRPLAYHIAKLMLARKGISMNTISMELGITKSYIRELISDYKD